MVFRRKVITTSGIRPPSWNFWVKKASSEADIYTSEKLAPKNISIDTEIASISVSVVKLLVLPVWGTVSTSYLYLMLFSEVGRCRYRWKWIGMPESCVVAADITLISLPVTNLKLLPVSVRHLEFTSAGSVRHGWRGYDGKICKNENRWNLVSSLHRTWHTAGGNSPPPPNCNIRYERHTCNSRVN